MLKNVTFILFLLLSNICFSQYTVGEYHQFLSQQKDSPIDYIFKLFESNDIVILGERDHRETTQYDLIFEILSDTRFINEIGYVYTEVGVVNQTAWGNRVLKREFKTHNEFDNELVKLYRELDYNALWDKYNMINYLRGIYAINKELDQDHKLTIGFTDCSFDWKGMTREQYQSFEKNNLEKLNVRDSIMASNFINQYHSQLPKNGKKKALYIQNRPHAEKIDRLIASSQIKTVGAYLRDEFKERVKTVALNWYNYASSEQIGIEWGKGYKLELSNDGKWDAAFELTKNKAVGFTIKGTPFGKTPFDYPYGDQHNVYYEDVIDGLIFYQPFYEFTCTRGLPGIVDRQFAKELIARQVISGVYDEGKYYAIDDELEDWNEYRTYDCVDYQSMIQQMNKWLEK